jgi:hypothetical protein
MAIDRGSSKHGARTDDMLAVEVRELLRSGHDTRADDWRTVEPALDDGPVPPLSAEPVPVPPLGTGPAGAAGRDTPGPGATPPAATADGAWAATDAAGDAAGTDVPSAPMTAADVVERAELARWLDRSAFPGRPRSIARLLRHHNAPDRFVDVVESLPPATTVDNVGELWRAIHDGGHVESRRF